MNRQVITTRGKPLQVAVSILRALSLLAVLGSALADPVALASQSDESPAVSGVRVIDGDTLEIDGHTVQLYGIDAPEVGQHCERADGLWACGAEAALFLQKIVQFEGPPVECSPWGEEPADDRAGPLVTGVCQVGPKVVGLTMVQNGYAAALPDSFPDYKEAEKQARQAKLGIWRGDFVPPWEWREGKGTAVRSSDWVRTCNVKGALGPAGERIYYVPTDEDYEDIAIDPARGERSFCSDEEARAAGWTRPGDTPPAE
jgi:endonuclease YncB( thermonuclease family)